MTRKNIYLIWRKGSGERRIPIGVLKKNATEGIQFQYLAKGVEEASNFGFQYFTSFPDVTKNYTENVLETFGQRIVKSERNDLSDFYEFWKVDESRKSDLFYMLAQTEGLLATDNFEFLADFHPVSELSFISEISGLSHTNISSKLLTVNDKLRFEREENNDFDKYAVKLSKESWNWVMLKKSIQK